MVIALDPDDALALYNRGVTYGNLGADYLDLALSDLESFLLVAASDDAGWEQAAAWVRQIKAGDNPFA